MTSEQVYIIVDDTRNLIDFLTAIFDKKIIYYQRPEQLLADLDKYPLDTKILLDNHIPGARSGIETAKELHEKGYTHLYLLTAEMWQQAQLPKYLTLIIKTDSEKIEEVFK